MAEILEEASGLESTTIGIYRTSATVKGGRRFSFSAMVVVGNRKGSVGLGYGKAPGVPAAIEKAQKNARKKMVRFTLQDGTLPHEVTGRFLSSKVRLLPASPGTGVIAGGTLRAILEMAGVSDCLTKAMGSTNQKNLSKAAMHGLSQLLSKSAIEELRGVSLENTHVDQILERGRRYAPAATPTDRPKAKGPQALKPTRGGGKGRGGKGGGGGGRGRASDNKPKPEAATAEAPAAESKPEESQ